MTSRFRWALFVVAIPLSLLQVAFAGALEDGNVAYERGDYAAALRFWQKPAEQGDRRAQQVVGLLYDLGYGVPQDLPAAVAWYRRAAEGGDATGEYRLAFMYDIGLGVAKDPLQASAWYRKAAEQGLPAAEGQMADMAERTGNIKEAMHWGERAYNDGDISAGLLICTLYRTGKVDPPDPRQQAEWCDFEKSGVFHDPQAGTEAVASVLTQDQMASIAEEMERAAHAFPPAGRLPYRLYAAATMRRPKNVELPARHDRYFALMSAMGTARVAARGLLLGGAIGQDLGGEPGIHILPETAMPMISDGGCSVVHVDYDAARHVVLPLHCGGLA